MRKLLLVVILFLSQFIMAQPVATKMQPGSSADGLVYFLPKTVIRFYLLVEKKTYTPGEYAKYAEKYLQLKGVSQEEQVTHSIVGCELTTLGVRDTSKCYAVKLKGKSQTADVRLSDDGVLLAVNAEPMMLKPRPPFVSGKPEQTGIPQYRNSEVLVAGSISKRAELTVQQIHELQEQRRMLVTGEADEMPQDEQQLQLMLSHIDRECEQLMSLFTGSVRRDTVEQVITLCPEKEVEREVVFRLSKWLGLVDKDDLSGVPYYMTIKDLHPVQYVTPENKKREGFYVNVPNTVQLTLFADDQQLAVFSVPLAQFGFVELRDGEPFKRYVTHLTLNPATGAVSKMFSDDL